MMNFWAVSSYCCRVAVDCGCVVANVNFRNAPEAPVPKGFEDGVAAIKYFHTNAAKYGVDENFISICGQSGGAWIALGAALLLVRADEQRLVRTIWLQSPMISNRFHSIKLNDKTPGFYKHPKEE